MIDDPFKNFNEASVKPETAREVLKTSSSKLDPSSSILSLKYGVLFIITLLFSLSVCPQRGVGFLRDDLPFFHHLLHQSELLCGLYCGFVFFITTHLLTFLLLNHFEKVKIVKHVSFVPALFMSAFFGLSMTSIFSNSNLGWTYNFSWLSVVGLSYYTVNQLFLFRLRRR